MDDWLAHYLKEPWGYEIESFRAAQAVTVMANGLFKPKTPYKHKDFIPDFDPQELDIESKEKQQVNLWKAQVETHAKEDNKQS